jgi:hypothetical protein
MRSVLLALFLAGCATTSSLDCAKLAQRGAWTAPQKCAEPAKQPALDSPKLPVGFWP